MIMSQTHVDTNRPLEVVIRGREEPVAYACPKCGMLFVLARSLSAEARAEKYEEAVRHCVTTCACGKPLERCYRLNCRDCQLEKERQKERARFEKAEKVDYEKYPEDMLYWEGHVGDCGDGYFSDLDSLLDYCEQEGLDIPEYVWACTPHEFTLDAGRVLEREIERQQLYEDAFDDIPEDAKKRLQEYLSVWARELNMRGWNVDYGRAVVLRASDLETPAVG